MYKMDKVFTFHISLEERYAIEILKQNDINISRFLRRSLRNMAKKLRYQDDKNASESKLT